MMLLKDTSKQANSTTRSQQSEPNGTLIGSLPPEPEVAPLPVEADHLVVAGERRPALESALAFAYRRSAALVGCDLVELSAGRHQEEPMGEAQLNGMLLSLSSSQVSIQGNSKSQPLVHLAHGINGRSRAPKLSLISSGSSSASSSQLDCEPGNKCGKCQNHEIETSKKGHARDCPFKKCECLKCRLLDARSDILQVISGKETKLKGTKKDPNCGFCQNHGVKVLRKGHVRSCGFGQERHFKLDNCFDCEVHYIRNEVNRLQIKMRRAMKEDRTLSEEQKKTAREAITREDVEKVCDMARRARKKRESLIANQAGGECSSQAASLQASGQLSSSSAGSPCSSISIPAGLIKDEQVEACEMIHDTHQASQHFSQLARQSGVWRPWSQHQVAVAMAHQQNQLNQQQQNQQNQQFQRQKQNQHIFQSQQQQHQSLPSSFGQSRRAGNSQSSSNMYQTQAMAIEEHQQQQQLASAITSIAVAANQSYLMNSIAQSQQRQRAMLNQHQDDNLNMSNVDVNNLNCVQRQQQQQQQLHDQQQQQFQQQQLQHHHQQQQLLQQPQDRSPSISPPIAINDNSSDQPLSLTTHNNVQEQQLLLHSCNTLFRLIVAQFAQPTADR